MVLMSISELNTSIKIDDKYCISPNGIIFDPSSVHIFGTVESVMTKKPKKENETTSIIPILKIIDLNGNELIVRPPKNNIDLIAKIKTLVSNQAVQCIGIFSINETDDGTVYKTFFATSVTLIENPKFLEYIYIMFVKNRIGFSLIETDINLELLNKYNIVVKKENNLYYVSDIITESSDNTHDMIFDEMEGNDVDIVYNIIKKHEDGITSNDLKLEIKGSLRGGNLQKILRELITSKRIRIANINGVQKVIAVDQ